MKILRWVVGIAVILIAATLAATITTAIAYRLLDFFSAPATLQVFVAGTIGIGTFLFVIGYGAIRAVVK